MSNFATAALVLSVLALLFALYTLRPRPPYKGPAPTCYFQETPPAAPRERDAWFNRDEGKVRLFIRGKWRLPKPTGGW